MEIVLKEKPLNTTIVEGFPGFGFVGTIATEFLINHLDAKPIGYLHNKQAPPMAAVHEGRTRRALEIFYVKKHNLIIFHAISSVKGFEWDIADALLKIARGLKVKEIISLEGVGSPVMNTTSSIYFKTNNSAAMNKFSKIKLKPLKEGIIMGISGALMLNAPKNIKTSFIFAEAHSKLPDSTAAAGIIKTLDAYLGLKVPYAPLLKQAVNFENKLKDLMQKGAAAVKEKEKKEISYLG